MGMDAPTATGGPVAASPASLVPDPRRAARVRTRPSPQRSDEHGHLTLPALRAYRSALQAEENKVSYWRRILQARLDVVRGGRTAGGTSTLSAATLRPVLTDERVGAGRRALVEIVPVDDIPPLPNLAELWERRVEPEDTDAVTALEEDLSAAEQQLSAYRAALHGRLESATGELIARYRESPALCLSSLPLAPSRD